MSCFGYSDAMKIIVITLKINALDSIIIYKITRKVDQKLNLWGDGNECLGYGA